MAAHKVGHDVLLHAEALVETHVFLHEPLVEPAAGFVHVFEHAVVDMLRRDLELAADVVLYKLADEGIVLIVHEIVVADAAADEDLFDAFDLPELSEELHIIPVVDLHVFAWSVAETGAVLADALRELFFAGGETEIRCRTADVVNIALKAGELS